MDTESASAPVKKDNRILLLILGAVVLACCCLVGIAALGGAGYFFYSSSPSAVVPEAEAPEAASPQDQPNELPNAEPGAPQETWLASPTDLESLSGDIGIVQWELLQTTPGEFRVCNSLQGMSWAYYPNQALNCIYITAAGTDLNSAIQDMFSNGQLFPDEVEVKSSLNIPYEHAVYVGTHSNAHTVIDMFVMDGGYLYWASVTIGTPAGVLPMENYGYSAEAIDTFLYNVIQLNMQRTQ